MSDQTTPPVKPAPVVPKPAAPVVQLPSKDVLKKHLADQEVEAVKHGGNPTINPFLWVAKYVKPLQDELKIVPSVTKELADKVFAVKFVLPVKK